MLLFAVSALVCYIEFCVEVVEVNPQQAQSEVVNVTSVLMNAARNKLSVPKQWSAQGNSKLKMKNDLIDWLKLG